MSRTIRHLAASLLLALTSPAMAGTGIYWTFVNKTSQDLYLTPAPLDESHCWAPSDFKVRSPVFAGQTRTFYIELGNCTDTAFTVNFSGAGYDGTRARIWAQEQFPFDLTVTRHLKSARSDKRSMNLPVMGIGSSSDAIDNSIGFTGQGWYDTIVASTTLSATHDPLPPGSYTQTCNADYDAASGLLRTDCMYPNLTPNYDASLNYLRICAPGSTVRNDNGQPACDHLSDRIPPGSYRQSCGLRDFDPDTGRLQAACADPAGRHFDTSLQAYYECEPGSTISNDNGTLRCDRPFIPGGVYTSQCRDIQYRNGILQGDCRTFVPLGTLRLDYQAQCAPWSSVSLGLEHERSALVCDTPKAR